MVGDRVVGRWDNNSKKRNREIEKLLINCQWRVGEGKEKERKKKREKKREKKKERKKKR